MARVSEMHHEGKIKGRKSLHLRPSTVTEVTKAQLTKIRVIWT